MKKRFNLILTIVFFLSPTYVSAITSDTRYETQRSNSTDTATFKRSMQKAMEDQKEKIRTLRSVVFNLKAPVVQGAGDKLIEETIMFEVKETLYKKFIDNPISQDPEFQATLLNIMNQSIITESDLQELQKAADEAHARQKN